jgi:hypothetical protein
MFLIGIGTAIFLALLWFTDIPLGIPGEWTWDRIGTEDGVGVFLGIVQAAIFGGLLILVAWSGNRRIADAPKWEVGVWLVALMAVAFVWLIAVQESPADGYRLNKTPWVLYYPGSSGYFDYARHEIETVDEFLAGYEDLMSEGDVLHQGTHPPGLFLFYRAIINAVDKYPSLGSCVRWSMTQSALDGFETLEENTRGSARFVTQADQVVIWWAFLLTQASCVIVIVPLYFLIRMSFSRTTAWRSIAFWPFVPAIAIFLPKSDVLFTGVSMTLVCLWCLAARRNSIVLGAIAGLVGFLGLFCSLAFLPIGLIALVIPIVGGFSESSAVQQENFFAQRLVESLKKQHRAIASALTCLIAATLSLGLWDMNLFNVWSMNYANHAGFYEQFTRTTWLWRLVNPVEFAFALGLPITILAACSFRKAVKKRNENRTGFAIAVATLGVWALLWASGKNSGEAARLWVPLMPLIIACLPTIFEQQKSESESSCSMFDADRSWLVLLGLQMIVALLTVSRISGFHFG